MNGRERIQATLRGESPDHLAFMPITMMFAADQRGVPYRQYATDHQTLVDAQLHTAETFGFDYVSAISDPAREAADCGARIEYFDDQPPAIVESDALLSDKSALAGLSVPDPLGGGRMHDRVHAVAGLRERVGDDLFVEGWVEGPIAEAADLRGLNTVMLDLIDDPGFVRDLFDFVVRMETDFAKAQIEAGADLIGLGDAAASLVGPQLYRELVWPYEKRLVDAIRQTGTAVRLHICGNTSAILDGMGELGCEIVDLDYLAPVAAARKAMGPDQVLLGNIEPVGVLRNGKPDTIYTAVGRCHHDAGPRFIVGAGCEVPRDTPPENLRAMLDYARSH